VLHLLVDDRLQDALPIEPTGPAIFTSAAHFMCVPPPDSSERSNVVVMFIIAPTPCPFTRSAACSSSRSSAFSMSTFIFRPPRPSGILTFAVHRLSSCTSKDSTPGIVAAIAAGSFSTFHTVARGASNVRSPSTFTRPPPGRPPWAC
jgi:hypothetical protein